MKNKNGFTLIEVLATIALLALLVVFVVPQVYKYLDMGYEKSLALQEKEVEDAAILYVEDFCKSPINSTYAQQCTLYSSINTEGFISYYGNILLSKISEAEYIGNISFRNKPCTEKSYITVNRDGEIKAYLKCMNSDDDDTPFVTEGYSEAEFNNAK